MMRLNKLKISRGYDWEDKPLTGEIEFSTKDIKQTVKISEESAKEILKIIADQIIETAKASNIALMHDAGELLEIEDNSDE